MKNIMQNTSQEMNSDKRRITMTRYEKAVEKHQKGYNCAQAVLCAFSDKIGMEEDDLFRLSEAFGGGMGGTQNVCGAVSGMVFVAGAITSAGIDKLPETNKKDSYAFAAKLMKSFEDKVGSLICADIKCKGLRSCDGCIEDAVKILEENL